MIINGITRALMAPLDEFARLHAHTMRTFGDQAIDLSYPNPRVLADRRPYEILANVAATASAMDLRYSPFGGFTTTRRVVAATLTRRHGLDYHYSDIVLTPGATAALDVVMRTLLSPEDRVVILRPCWMDYPLYLASLGIGCDLVDCTVTKRIDVDTIAYAWTAGTRALILSQPVSPTGVVHTANELRQLGDRLHELTKPGREAPLLISDEVHRDQVWGADVAVCPAAVYPNTLSIFSYGKAWQMQGQRTGYVAVSPQCHDRTGKARLLQEGMRLTGHCAPTAIMQRVVNVLSDYAPNAAPLRAVQRRARTRLAAAGYRVVEAQATPFVYARSPQPNETAFVRELASRGVLAMPSTLFHERGHFRLALNVDGDDLDRALDLLNGAFAEVGGHD